MNINANAKNANCFFMPCLYDKLKSLLKRMRNFNTIALSLIDKQTLYDNSRYNDVYFNLYMFTWTSIILKCECVFICIAYRIKPQTACIWNLFAFEDILHHIARATQKMKYCSTQKLPPLFDKAFPLFVSRYNTSNHYVVNCQSHGTWIAFIDKNHRVPSFLKQCTNYHYKINLSVTVVTITYQRRKKNYIYNLFVAVYHSNSL